MPAKEVNKTAKAQKRVGEGGFSHIYNKGVDKKILFNDNQDYDTFIGFLGDYLTSTSEQEKTKKTFTINGRQFIGVPHQPKNYFGKVEVIAYILSPDHFHLVLHQITKGSQERFLRSLLTRYSMYFNKKYKRTGSLFEGPYKFAQVKDMFSLLLLTYYLHNHKVGDSSLIYSSLGQYLGTAKTGWVKADIVIDYLNKSKPDSLKDFDTYQNFVKGYQLSQNEKQVLEGIILESSSVPLEKRPDAVNSSKTIEKDRLKQKESFASETDQLPNFSQLAFASAIFLLLLGLGLKNVIAYSDSKQKSQEASVSGISSESAPPPPLEEVEKPQNSLVKVNTGDISAYVNIRKEPNTSSEKIGKAYDGEIFVFTGVTDGWYEIQLDVGRTGFISKEFVEEKEDNN